METSRSVSALAIVPTLLLVLMILYTKMHFLTNNSGKVMITTAVAFSASQGPQRIINRC
ncbi:hypothetical protein BJX76DRAFT_6254 [Aspergillus varians]